MNPTDSLNADSDPPRYVKLRGRPFYEIGFALFIAVTVLMLLFERPQPDSPRSMPKCKSNLKQIGLALHNYHDTFGCFPPAYLPDANGRPMHSWRVLLLPYLDQAPLYQQYRFDEPWDGPNNSLLANSIVKVFNCPDAARDPKSPTRFHTDYVAVIGPDTMWPGAEPVKFSDVFDGTPNTVMVVEVSHSGIHWMEPRDLHALQMTPTVNAAAGQGISSIHTGGANTLFADGSVRFLSDRLSAESIRALLTRSGNDDPGEN